MARETISSIIDALIDRGLTRSEIYGECKPMVDAQTEPMVFKFNPKEPGGKREVMPLTGEKNQYTALWYTIGRRLVKKGKGFDRTEPMPILDENRPVPDVEIPTPAPSPRKESDEELFVRRVEEIHTFCNRRAEISEAVDEIGNRPFRDGVRGIREGISVDAMLNAMTLHWPQDARSEAGIAPFDWDREYKRLFDEYGLGEGWHKAAGYVIALCNARIPAMLVGPAGSGKSHLCKQVAGKLDLDYAECPMTAGATPSWLLGNIQLPTENNPDGYRPRQQLKMYSAGGVFNYEEIDAADPNMLLVMNQILAADTFYNPVNGEHYDKSENFVPMSTANTFGLGANRAFTARERMDAASIDRWRMGRAFIAIDIELAKWVALNQ